MKQKQPLIFSILFFSVLVTISVLISATFSSQSLAATTQSLQSKANTKKSSQVLNPKPVKALEVPKVPEGDVLVRMDTHFGVVYLDLYKKGDPITVDHFLKFVDNGFYDNTIFHRIIDGFVIQGGGYGPNLKLKANGNKTVDNQSKINGYQNLIGTIAMARTSDPNSATTQFYINLANNTNLDGNAQTFGYTVFGKVVQGMDVLKKIAKIKVGEKNNAQNVPVYPDEALIVDMVRVKSN